MNFIVIQTSTATRADAEKLARLVVEGRLAACVNIFRNEISVYEWKGEMCAEQEYILHIKTRAELYGKVEAALKANHPYETPAIVAWDVTHVDAKYAAWVGEQTVSC